MAPRKNPHPRTPRATRYDFMKLACLRAEQSFPPSIPLPEKSLPDTSRSCLFFEVSVPNSYMWHFPRPWMTHHHLNEQLGSIFTAATRRVGSPSLNHRPFFKVLRVRQNSQDGWLNGGGEEEFLPVRHSLTATPPPRPLLAFTGRSKPGLYLLHQMDLDVSPASYGDCRCTTKSSSLPGQDTLIAGYRPYCD